MKKQERKEKSENNQEVREYNSGFLSYVSVIGMSKKRRP